MENTEQATEIIVTRRQLYPTPNKVTPGPAWRWTYSYTVDGGPVAQYGTGIASLRSMLKRRFRGAQIIEKW